MVENQQFSFRETKGYRPSRISEQSFRKKVGYTSLELREEIGLETQDMSRAAPVCRWHLNLWAWYFNMGGKEPSGCVEVRKSQKADGAGEPDH